MNARKLHRAAGLALLLPFAGWVVTGFVFFLKPGYGPAYEQLRVRTYPLEKPVTLPPRPEWRESRVLKTVLGRHLLARTEHSWEHLDADTLAPRPEPSTEERGRLLEDALRGKDAERYGRLLPGEPLTDTGVRLALDWKTLTILQAGPDTDRINALYKIHYLQWTGVKTLDRVLGFLGLAAVAALSLLGLRLTRGRLQSDDLSFSRHPPDKPDSRHPSGRTHG